jgi:type IV secretory pathway ATPase VirB11/archaellum biosynthesis ATPase
MAILHHLIKKYGDVVDFNQLKGFNKPGWENGMVLNEERMTMTSAALLHFNGDAGNLVRWVGGTHVGVHRQTNAILKFLRGHINDNLWMELH